jgi:hypothetical protein
VVKVTPTGPSTGGAVLDTFVQPEFFGGSWTDVIRVHNLSMCPAAGANIRAYAISPAPPADQIASLIGDVEDLVTGGTLTAEQGALLTTLLDDTSERSGAGPAETAASLLRAFINDVGSLVDTGMLKPAAGQALVNAASAIIRHM